MKFKNTIIGGTFDHFHKGHKHLLSEGFGNSEKVTIGISTDKFLKKKNILGATENYKTRKKNVTDYLIRKGFAKKSKIIPLDDIYGNSLKDKNIDAIFVTEKTIKNAYKINLARKKKGFSPIQIVSVGLIFGNDKKIISSTRIRNGEIDRDGNSHLNLFRSFKEYILKDEYRLSFRRPLGDIIDKASNLKRFRRSFVVAVGDITIFSFLSQGISPNVSLFDLKTKREEITQKNILKLLPKEKIILSNRQGTINSKTARILQEIIKKSLLKKENAAIKIIGEEDLLTLPAILFAPLNAVVCYGLRDIGAVVVKVTEEKKDEVVKNYMDKFEKR